MPRLLYLLMLCNLVLGTGVFVIGGILVPISESLQVSVAAAGQATTAYAISTALLAPLMLVATGRWPRRRALVFGLLLFAFGNLVCALATSLTALLCGALLAACNNSPWPDGCPFPATVAPVLSTSVGAAAAASTLLRILSRDLRAAKWVSLIETLVA